MQPCGKIQLGTIQMAPGPRLIRSERWALAVALLAAMACSEASVEPIDAGPPAPNDSGTDARVEDVGAPFDSDASLDGKSETSSDTGSECTDAWDAASEGCPVVDGVCAQGCGTCGGNAYDPERKCLFRFALIACYDPTNEFPPASPVPMKDPCGQCWILYNPPHAIYGSSESGWTSPDSACLEGFSPNIPVCDEG